MRKLHTVFGGLLVALAAAAAAVASTGGDDGPAPARSGNTAQEMVGKAPSQAYGALRRPAAAGEALKSAPDGAKVRRIGGGGGREVFMTATDNEVCVVVRQDEVNPGGVTCGKATLAAAEPPILIQQRVEQGVAQSQVYGVVPDDVTEIVLTDGQDRTIRVRPSGNGWSAALPPTPVTNAPLKKTVLKFSDGSASSLSE